MSERDPATDWQGKWDSLGSTETRIAYLRRYWPWLLRALSSPETTPAGVLDEAALEVVTAWRAGKLNMAPRIDKLARALRGNGDG